MATTSDSTVVRGAMLTVQIGGWCLGGWHASTVEGRAPLAVSRLRLRL